MASNRMEKINAEIMREISDIINNRLKDPRVNGIISVLSVKTSADLKHADVFISIFNGENDKQTFEALNNSTSFFRRELSRSLALRTIPMLHFVNDNSLQYSRKISDIIEGLK